MSLLTISPTLARRFVLGLQGLWPGRRWAGESGTAAALRQIEAVQVDPLNVVARSHDIVLWSRVANYQPALLDKLLYTERAFFDYGGTVMICPMDELPYWRVVMRQRTQERRWSEFAAHNAALIERVRAELHARGPLGNRDLAGTAKTAKSSYRTSKDTGLALYYLWLTGELMTHHRKGFERIYAPREQVAPAHLNVEAPAAEAEAFLARKTLAWRGLLSARNWALALSGIFERKVSREEGSQLLDDLRDAGDVTQVQVEGWAHPSLLLARDVPLLESLVAGEVPHAWRPLDTTTEDEAVFLAPLDIVSTRGRAQVLFDFEYLWEVYKPEEKRRWGYYTLPVLYGDRLVARLDPKLDRESGTLVIKGFWLEAGVRASDEAMVAALARGLAHFGRFVGARALDVTAVKPVVLRKRLGAGWRAA